MSFIDPLLALQDVDMQIFQLQKELTDLPKRKKAEEIRLDDRTRALAEFAASPDAALDVATKEAFESEIAEVKSFICEIDAHLADVNAEVTSLETKRAELASNVRPEHLLIYDRLRVSRHPTIVKLTNNTCSGCHLAQPPAIGHLIRRDNQLVTCEMCGRILYC